MAEKDEILGALGKVAEVAGAVAGEKGGGAAGQGAGGALGGAGGIGGAAGQGGALGAVQSVLTRRGFAGAQFALEIGPEVGPPIQCGFVQSVDGGNFKSEAIDNKIGLNQNVAKIPGKPKVDDITITMGLSVLPLIFPTIYDRTRNRTNRVSGAIVGMDREGGEQTRRTFQRAIVTEIGLPALKAGQGQAANITIKVSPELLKYETGRQSKAPPNLFGSNELFAQKQANTADFSFQIDGISQPFNMKTAAVEAFTIKQNVIEHPIGSQLEPRKEFGRIEFPNLVMTISQRAEWIKPMMDWYDKSIRNQNFLGERRTGTLVYQSATGQEYLRFDLDGVRIVAVEMSKHAGGSEEIATVKFTFSVEDIFRPKTGK